MSELLTVIAEIQAKPGLEDVVRETLLGLVAPTHAEEGCVDYDLHESLDEKGLFFFYENWTSEAALKEHLERSHLKAFAARADELLSKPVRIIRCRKLHAPKKQSVRS